MKEKIVAGKEEKKRIFITTHVRKLQNGKYMGYVVRCDVTSRSSTKLVFFCNKEQNSIGTAHKDAEDLARGG